jgi:hypothetical protein
MSPVGVLGRVSGLFARLGGAGAAISGEEPPRQRQRRLERELEEARRLGHWFTEEDRQLVREHEARLAAERRGELVRQAGRNGAVALLLMACVQPLLWPLALVGGVKAFPRSSRRLGIGLLGLTGVGLIGATVALVQVGRTLLSQPESAVPALAPATAPSVAPAPDRVDAVAADRFGSPLGRDIAERLSRTCDYWTLEGTGPDGTATYRKALYRLWNGQQVMVLPRSSWTFLSGREQRALADYLAKDLNIRAIHVGRVERSTAFAGNTIHVEERVWP